MRIITLLLLTLATGCASIKEMDKAEIAFQLGNAVDAYQTMQIRKNPCLSEGDPFTSKVLGEQPDPAATFAYFFSRGILYHVANKSFEDEKWWKVVSTLLNLGNVKNVANNYHNEQRDCHVVK